MVGYGVIYIFILGFLSIVRVLRGDCFWFFFMFFKCFIGCFIFLSVKNCV